jgi:hypothetical protein
MLPPNPDRDKPDSVDNVLADLSCGHVRFADRRNAGRRLAAALRDLRDQDPVVVRMEVV